jgi:hypothetical protein
MPVLFPGSKIFDSVAGATVATGDWYSIPAEYGDLTWQAVLYASSVGATAGSTVTMQLSNTTAVAAVTAQTIALTCTTDTVSNGGGLAGTTMQGAWKYARAVLTSLTTSTAGSAGSPNVEVFAYAGKRS